MMTPNEKLLTFTIEQLRREVAILHGLAGFDGFTWHGERGVFAREVQPGVWISLGPPTASETWLEAGTGTGTTTICPPYGPGWFWYIGPEMGTYSKRGGACLGDDALADALAELHDWPAIADDFLGPAKVRRAKVKP